VSQESENANQEWIRTLEDGRMVKSIYQTAPGGGPFVIAQIAANEIVYSILLTKARPRRIAEMSKAATSFRKNSAA
jgi:hypothetical protein